MPDDQGLPTRQEQREAVDDLLAMSEEAAAEARTRALRRAADAAAELAAQRRRRSMRVLEGEA